MYTIWVIALSLGVVSADVGLGYHYKVPETSYGVPSHQIGGSRYSSGLSSGSTVGTGSTGSGISFGSGSTGSGFSIGSGSSGSGVTASPDIGYSTSGSSTGFNYNQGTGSFNYNTQGTPSGAGFNYNTQPVASSGYNFNGIATGSANQGSFQGFAQNGQSGSYYQTGGSGISGTQPSQLGGSGYFNQYQTSNDYQSSAVQKYQDYYKHVIHQPPQIYKHFYVHAAPEEPEIPKHRQPIVLPPPQKHYKIIFIKTPSQPAAAPQFIPVQQQNEEKTIVYVLVKKPEDAQNVVLPKIEPKPPTKPEVFFIKYNNKQDSQAVINNIVNDYNKGSASGSYSGLGTSGYFEGVKGSGSSGASEVVSGGSSSSEFGSSLGQSGPGISEGAYAVSSTGSSGSAFGGVASEAGSQGSGSFSSHYTPGPAVSLSTVGSESHSSGVELESIFGSSGSGISSSTVSSEAASGYDASAISTSQGVPHETYGPPNFKPY
ncbi:uncharacterized protein [Epargyreus clarus]|uniref:uncharacterized protein n=1 Tax=Epargyreus clarus TaxID=520877 RepID=UPI003C2BAC18